ncbi:MAG: hypothetical protein ACC656_02250 [Candidatus Heimdallarchaeota archaeon]
MDSIKQLYNELRDTYQTIEESLSHTKRELLAMHSVAQERQKQIQEFEKSTDVETFERYKKENAEMKTQLEEYQMRAARGITESSPNPNSGSPTSSSKIGGVITPVMLNEFDPENPRYQDAHVNLVEAAIRDGDVLEKIIGILVKYGGNGPIKKVEGMVGSSEFRIGVEVLMEEKIVKLVDDTLYLANSSDMIVLQNSWDNLETDDLFDQLKKIIAKDPMDDVVIAIGKFRDALQERNIPLTTMLFQIRKMMEGMEKRSMTRTEGLKQVNEWYQKISQ